MHSAVHDTHLGLKLFAFMVININKREFASRKFGMLVYNILKNSFCKNSLHITGMLMDFSTSTYISLAFLKV